MDLTAISAFVTVGDKGGFRAAATALGMTPAGVSKAVARLEATLGVTLVARTTRSVRLTAAGVAYQARCKAILADLDAAGHEAAEASTGLQGRMVISMTRAFGRVRVLPAIAEFVRQHPQVEVEARLTDEMSDLVCDGVDLAIRIGDLPDSSMIATRISETRFIMCASPEYLATNGIPAHPDDLTRHSVIGYVTPGTAIRFHHRFLINGEIRTVCLPSCLVMDEAEAIVAAGMRSVGLVMANDYLMQRQIAEGSLIRVLAAFEPPSRPVSIVQLPTRHPSPAARAFTELLRRQLASETQNAMRAA